MRNHTIRAAFVVSLALGSLLAFAAAAGATTVDPSVSVQTVLDDGTNAIVPIILEVVAAMLGILVLVVGIRMAWNALRRPGKAPVR